MVQRLLQERNYSSNCYDVEEKLDFTKPCCRFVLYSRASSRQRHSWGMIRHDGRFVRDIMKMSPMYGETTRTTTKTTKTTATAAACEAFTNISTLVCARVVRGGARCTCVYTRVDAHRHCTHYLMAPTYVLAVSRSLREQSGSPGSIGLVLFLSPFFFFFFSVFSVQSYSHSLRAHIVDIINVIDIYCQYFHANNIIRCLKTISYYASDIVF
ncbi:uncharacterized protein LOC109611152 [Ooceraea biroi]|uniref:uncharacterized protein LOC109611152 n=1 Tax=Ooceraea biroi TaxID=2015173 RepID=UPI0009715A5E|nr:uncharacterized protein LOC109611152 [Ooceraea biroi]